MLNIIKKQLLNPLEKEQLFNLWNSEYPEKLTYKAIEELNVYLSNLSEQSHYLLQDMEGNLAAWAVTFTRENERWFAVIVASKIQGEGVGTRMLNLLKQDENKLFGWVIDHNRDKRMDGNPYNSPIEFYRKNGFNIIADARLELQIISAVEIVWAK